MTKPWKTTGRTIYLDDQIVGMMDTQALAYAVVDAMNRGDAMEANELHQLAAAAAVRYRALQVVDAARDAVRRGIVDAGLVDAVAAFDGFYVVPK